MKLVILLITTVMMFSACTKKGNLGSISSNKTISPEFTATAFALSFAWNNNSIGAVTNGYSVFKNGTACSGGCLSTISATDTIRVEVDPGAYVNDVLSWNVSGNASSVNTTVNNQVTFVMGNQNVTVTATVEDKDIVNYDNSLNGMIVDRATGFDIRGAIGGISGVTDMYNVSEYHSSTNPVKLSFENDNWTVENDRTITVYNDLTCTNVYSTINSVGETSSLTSNVSLNLNGITEFSFKYTNVTKQSPCFKRKILHMTSITKTTETFVLNNTIESGSGDMSFFKSGTNTLNTSCLSMTALGNPDTGTYDYGKLNSLYSYTVEAYTNSNLVTPYYTYSYSMWSICNTGTQNFTIPADANYATADVIKLRIVYKNSFGATFEEVLSTNVVQ